MNKEKIVEELNYLLNTMPYEPPLGCDYVDEWVDADRKLRTALEGVIKFLEQPQLLSEDCVSRHALYESLYEHFHEDNPNNITEVTLGSVRNFVKNFPSVQPAHGTCKDCAMKRLDKSESEEVGAEKYFCPVVGNYVDETPNFYCAAFEKRNGEPQAATCTSCGSVFSYRAEDIQYGYVVSNGKYGYRKSVKCPYCNNAIVVKEETEYTKEEG